MRKRNENDESVFLTAIAAGNDYCYKTDDFLTLFDENLRSDRSPILYAILNNRPDAIDAILDLQSTFTDCCISVITIKI